MSSPSVVWITRSIKKRVKRTRGREIKKKRADFFFYFFFKRKRNKIIVNWVRKRIRCIVYMEKTKESIADFEKESKCEKGKVYLCTEKWQMTIPDEKYEVWFSRESSSLSLLSCDCLIFLSAEYHLGKACIRNLLCYKLGEGRLKGCFLSLRIKRIDKRKYTCI